MREIEIKAQVSDKDSLLRALEAAGVQLSEPLKQRDIVYNEPGKTTATPGYNFLRVRIENDSKATFTLKQTVKDLHKIEHETEISNADEMIAMIELMHYELFNDLTKIRRKAAVGEVEICVDEVTNLGVFIEAEKMADDDIDAEAVRVELWRLLETYGVDRAGEVTKGYDILMREKLANE